MAVAYCPKRSGDGDGISDSYSVSNETLVFNDLFFFFFYDYRLNLWPPVNENTGRNSTQEL